MTVIDFTRRIIDICEGAGVDPKQISDIGTLPAGEWAATIRTHSCPDLDKLAKAFRIATSSRHMGAQRHPFVIREGVADGVLIQHHCFPHLDCWETS